MAASSKVVELAPTSVFGRPLRREEAAAMLGVKPDTLGAMRRRYKWKLGVHFTRLDDNSRLTYYLHDSLENWRSTLGEPWRHEAWIEARQKQEKAYLAQAGR